MNKASQLMQALREGVIVDPSTWKEGTWGFALDGVAEFSFSWNGESLCLISYSEGVRLEEEVTQDQLRKGDFGKVTAPDWWVVLQEGVASQEDLWSGIARVFQGGYQNSPQKAIKDRVEVHLRSANEEVRPILWRVAESKTMVDMVPRLREMIKKEIGHQISFEFMGDRSWVKFM